jgi:ABC-type multidrug transport system ATPase subunit
VLLFGSLVSSKPFWLLDDPLGAFDPQARSELAPLLLQAAARGAGILWTASELLGVEQLATQVCLLDGGRVVAHGTPELLRAQSGLHGEASLDQVCVSLARAASPARRTSQVASL